MSERYFPFTSYNDDRLYGSADFRSFFRTILGNGRITYDEIMIVDPKDGLLCSIDSIDASKINVSPGACFLFGGQYQTDAIVTLTAELPTGSSTIEGYIVARIDPDVERDIKLMLVQAVTSTGDDRNNYLNPETDLVLGRYSGNSSGITGINSYGPDAGDDEILVAYAKYNLNKEQQDYIIEQLGKNTDLINYLATNTSLIGLLGNSAPLVSLLAQNTNLINALASNPIFHNALANNPDFIALVKGLNFEYTYVVASNADLERWRSSTSGYDFTAVLIKKGSYTFTTAAGVSLSGRNTYLVDAEEGAELNINSTSVDNYCIANSTADEEKDKRTVRNLTINVKGCGRGFQRIENIVNCTVNFNNQTTAAFVGFYYCNNVSSCKLNLNSVVTQNTLAFEGCNNVNGITIKAINNVSNLIHIGKNYNNITITSTISGASSNTTLINRVDNISNVVINTGNFTTNSNVYAFASSNIISNVEITCNNGPNRSFDSCNVISGVIIKANCNSFRAFNNSTSISNVKINATVSSIHVDTGMGFNNCTTIDNADLFLTCTALSDTNYVYGYYGCGRISNSRCELSGLYLRGYYSSTDISNSHYASSSNATWSIGYDTCQRTNNIGVNVTNAVNFRGINGGAWHSNINITATCSSTGLIMGVSTATSITGGQINITSNGGSANGIDASFSISNMNIYITATNGGAGFSGCNRVNNSAVSMTGNANSNGYMNTHQIDNCTCNITVASAIGNAMGFNSCSKISNSISAITNTNTSSTSNDIVGYVRCDNLSGCVAMLGTTGYATTGATGFDSCNNLIFCSTTSSQSNISRRIGFSGCRGLSHCNAGYMDDANTMYKRAFNYCWALDAGPNTGGGSRLPANSEAVLSYQYGWNVGVAIA